MTTATPHETDCDGLIDLLSSSSTSLPSVPAATADRWRELKARCEEEYASRNAPPPFSSSPNRGGDIISGRRPYLSEAEVRIGLRKGRYFRGKLDVTRANPREGYVSVADTAGCGGGGAKKMKYYLDNERGYFNRSLHGDAVVIEPLPEMMWGRPVGRRRLVHAPRVENCLGPVSGTTKAALLDKRVVQLRKLPDGTRKKVWVENECNVIQLAAQLGSVDLTDMYGVPPGLAETMDVAAQVAVAAGMEALESAGLVPGKSSDPD